MSSWGTPRRDCTTAALRLAAGALLWVVAFLALMTAVVSCQPDDDGTNPRDCGELDQPRHCDGQSAPATPSTGTVPASVSVGRPVSRHAGRQPLVQAGAIAPLSLSFPRGGVEQWGDLGLHVPAVPGGAPSPLRPARDGAL